MALQDVAAEESNPTLQASMHVVDLSKQRRRRSKEDIKVWPCLLGGGLICSHFRREESFGGHLSPLRRVTLLQLSTRCR
jgi:hypothetical protein